MASFTGPTLSYPRSVETTGYYLNFYTYDYNKAQSLGVKSIRDMLTGNRYYMVMVIVLILCKIYQ